MLLTARVRLVLEGSPEVRIPGVKVALYDRDIGDEDDPLGEDLTDDVGEILFGFEFDVYTDAEDRDMWRISSLPDLYVIVYDAAGEVVLSTRSQTRVDKLPRLFTVEVSRDLAEAHGLID